jgi:dynein light intermediate chain
VRDEIKMTIQAYQTLYESSIAYGMRKALQAEQSKAEMLIKITNIEEECSDLEEIVDDLKKRINRMLREEEKDKIQSKERHEEEIASLSNDNNNFMI